MAELAGELLPPPASTVIKVTRAAHTTVRKAEKAEAAKTGTRERPAGQRKAQQAGRRGGLSKSRPSPARPAFLRRVGR